MKALTKDLWFDSKYLVVVLLDSPVSFRRSETSKNWLVPVEKADDYPNFVRCPIKLVLSKSF